jgi:hypothetical protein
MRQAETNISGHGAAGIGDIPEKEIRRRAFEIHLARGGATGWDMQDWLQAERELTERK